MKDESEQKAEAKDAARDELIYHLTEDLLVVLEERGLSKADLARRIGKSRSFVTQVLSGDRNMTLRTLSDICFELQVNPVVKILPNGSRVLQYDEDQTWSRDTTPRLKSVSTNIVAIFESEAQNEYRLVKRASGV